MKLLRVLFFFIIIALLIYGSNSLRLRLREENFNNKNIKKNEDNTFSRSAEYHILDNNMDNLNLRIRCHNDNDEVKEDACLKGYKCVRNTIF